MLDSIGSSETGVHQKTLNRLVKFIDQFKAMNFVNDTVMEQQLEEAKKELRGSIFASIVLDSKRFFG